MNDEKYEKLVEKLNGMLSFGVDASPSVSPHLRAPSELSSLGVYITKDLNVDELSEPQALLVHALLHKFYAGGNKAVTKKEIEQLHLEITKKIGHSKFDSLDETC
jgi:hypothetical protein